MQPGSKQAKGWHQSAAQGLGTLAIERTLELEWPFRVVLSLAKMAWPLSLWVGLGRGIMLGNVALCSQDDSLAEAVLEGDSYQLGHQDLPQRDSE